MKSSQSQNSDPYRSNTFDAIDSVIIGLIICFILVGACLLGPVYFTTHLVLGLIKPADPKPAKAASNPVENNTQNNQTRASQDASQMPRCRVS